MELTQLRSFLAIVRSGNLTRAAEARHLSQSALSSQIKALEESLGVTLFVRSRRGMQLSDGGKLLLPQIQELLEAQERLQRSARTLQRGITASVSIGLNADPAFLRISALNQRLGLLHGDLNVIFHSSRTATTPQQLRHSLIDLGFYYGPLFESDVISQRVSEVRIGVVIPTRLTPKQPPDWQELTALPWIWVDDKFPFFTALQEKLGRLNAPPARIVTAANEQIVRELLLAGQGVALVREDEALELEKQQVVTIWEPGWTRIPLNLGWLEKSDTRREVVAAREAIRHIWSEAPPEAGSLADKAWA